MNSSQHFFLFQDKYICGWNSPALPLAYRVLLHMYILLRTALFWPCLLVFTELDHVWALTFDLREPGQQNIETHLLSD